MSTWCQDFLGLPDSELNSLWYERLAEVSFSQNSKADTVLSLYRRAVEKENSSWLCHRGLAKTYFGQDRTQEAIVQVELALKEAEREGAMPKPEDKDIVELHLLLGLYAYDAGDVQKAAEHYLLARQSKDPVQARQGQLGYLKAGLGLSDVEATRQLLRSTVAREGEDGTMSSILKMIARDVDHDDIVFKMFTVAKGEPELLKAIVRAMEAATAMPTSNDDRTAEMIGDAIYAEDEARGVLLYDRGIAAYRYKVSPDGTEAVGEALRLWRESYNLLSNVGGRNAFMARLDATTALSQHYFQEMLDGDHLDHVGALTKLTEGADSDVYFNDAVGFLGTVYALHGDKEQARAVLARRMKQALQILSDDISQNDRMGFLVLQKTLEQYQDFENAAVALSFLGQPDLVTDALRFDPEDVAGSDGVDKERLLDMVTKLAGETIRVARNKAPGFSQQLQRIEAAEAHVSSLMDTAGTKPGPEADDDHTDVERSEGQGEGDKLTAAAHGLLYTRLSTLQQKYTDGINVWSCDGRTPDGKECENTSEFSGDFYHCVYCSNIELCPDCLSRLRRPPDSGAEVTVCSARHRWLRIPPQGGATYVGPRAKSAPVPREVRPTEGDGSILEICYDDEGGGRKVAVEAWKEALAKEWHISLEEIRREISKQATRG